MRFSNAVLRLQAPFPDPPFPWGYLTSLRRWHTLDHRKFIILSLDWADADDRWIRATVGNLVAYEYHEKGGHFAAHERPEDLAQDVKKMFAKGGPAYGVVSGKDGYP